MTRDKSVRRTVPIPETVNAFYADKRRRIAERTSWTPDAIPPPTRPAEVVPDDLLDMLPRSPKSIVKLAKENGWRVVVTDSVGPRVGAAGKVLQDEVHSLAVRCYRKPFIVIGFWLEQGEKWVTDGWLQALPDTRIIDLKEAKAILVEEGQKEVAA